MAIYLGESTVLPVQPYQQSVSITKKISNYIFRFEDKIGQGNFSKVYKGFHQLTNQQVAIKIIELSSVKSAKLQELLFSEIQVIQSLNHPNILKCHQVLKSENNCYIITELCNGGDLQSLLKKQKFLNQISAAPYIRDIFKGLLYLGERGIVHRDLKIANIFLHNGVCKIADFGFAKYTNNQSFFDLDIGSPLYMSPEGMIQHLYGMKTDVWSFGIILFELLHGKTPFSYCSSEYELKRAVVTPISYHSIRPDLSPEVRQLILKCLIVDCAQRPDAISLKNDPFLLSLLNGLMKQNIQMKKNEPHFIHPVQQILPFQTQQNFLPQQLRKVETMKNSANNVMNQNLNMQPMQTSTQYLNTKSGNQTTARQMQSASLPQIHVPLEFNTNSPTRLINNFGNQIKQFSIKDSKKKQRFQDNEPPSSGNIEHSMSINAHPRSYDNIQTNSYADLIPQINFPKHGKDKILIPEDKHQKEKSQINDNSDKVSNSSWSHDNVGRKKFPKTLSHQNIYQLQNNLGMINSQNKVKDNLNTSVNTRVQSSFQSTSLNQTPQKIQHSNSHRQIEKSVSQSFNGKIQINPSQKLSFKEENIKSSKKFGEMIKGEKKTDSNIKSIIKLDKTSDLDQNLMIERAKTKSHIKFDQASTGNMLQIPEKNRTARHSFGDVSSSNQPEYMNQSFNLPTGRVQLPTFIQEKEKQKQELKRNLICTIMEFKEAVGFLHYCRLYYRFVATLKKTVLFPEIKKYEFLAKCFKNYEQHAEFYRRYLLTALNELIQNIRCKEIIYDGQSYKKKKIKEDKLKEVTEEYFKKYMEEVNRSRTQHHKIVPIYIKSTSISFMKEQNQQFWEALDRQYNNVIQLSRKTTQIGQNFIRNFRNLCYFGIRINQANEIIANCIHLKNYKLLGDTLMENWLTQEYYGEEVYFKLKNDHFRKINASNALKNSQTNDTETENHSRAKYL